jgi:hypothetical protein
MNRLLVAALAALPMLAVLTGCPGEPFDGDPVVTDPAQLKAPLTGEGFQFRTELFSVAPGEEVQDCYFYKVRDLAKAGGLPENEPVNLHRLQMVQKDGSHHMNIFRVRTIVGLDPNAGPVQRAKNGQGECFKSPNWSDWPLVANTQQDGNVDWTFPDGIANVFQPDEWLMLQTHYVNAGTQKTPEKAQVAVNFHTMKKEDVKHELGTLFATKQSVRVCRNNPSPSFSGTCQFNGNQPVNIIGANGHFHSRGKQFDMYTWDGTSITQPPDASRFYRSQTWDDPPMLRSPDLDITVQPKGGVYFSCGYQWTPPADEVGCAGLDAADKSTEKDCCYTFGPIVEKNEHCNAFVYYWPKQEATDIACN